MYRLVNENCESKTSNSLNTYSNPKDKPRLEGRDHRNGREIPLFLDVCHTIGLEADIYRIDSTFGSVPVVYTIFQCFE